MNARYLRSMTCAAVLGVLAACGSVVEGAATISVYADAASPVRHAVGRLSNYTGMEIGLANADREIRIELSDQPNPALGEQGYSIRSEGDSVIAIRGNDHEGVANGIYTLLRTSMIEHEKDPFRKTWNVQEKPRFAVRSMLVSPYRFGASYGFAALSPDRWSIQEWKEYVDLMRLCNMTTLTMGSERVYHPDYPQSYREKWRYEVWKEVMDYCHEVGIKFNWFIAPNLVPQEAFWRNPDERAIQEAGAWYGCGLIWGKAKDKILDIQKYTLEHFRGLDGLEIIYSDGGGFSFDEQTGADPAAYFADATRSYIELLKQTGNQSEFVYWNWVLDFWSKVMLPEHVLEEFPKYRTMQDDVLPLLPKDITYLDTSLLTVIQVFGPGIQAKGNPPLRETILLGKEHGFRRVIDVFWYMNPETALNMFPHPYIRRGIQEAKYAADELDVDGVMGYRLAPPCRFLGDYAFFRLACDPSLTQEQLADEMAGLLCDKPENRRTAAEAVNTLENFWSTKNLDDLAKAERLFRDLLKEEKSKRLEYVSNGVTFLSYLVRMAKPEIETDQRNLLKIELYQTIKPMYIFQGFTSDVIWQPESLRFFFARVEMMVEDYRNFSHMPEVVDRSIYPKATSKPFRLKWPTKPDKPEESRDN